MELSKHKPHRNVKYLNWLRKQPCVVSGEKAQCAHHVRLGTNGGASLKPSDYFCIPLLNEYHTTGACALHNIGEETFFKQFGLEPLELFIKYLKAYLIEKFEIYYMLEGRTPEETLADLIGLAQNKLPKMERATKKPSKKRSSPETTSFSLSENKYYQKAKEFKRERDKELRKKLKEKTDKKKVPFPKAPAKTLKGDEFYEKAKEKRKLQEKEYRKKNKEKMAAYRKELKAKFQSKKDS
ncbi:MAG: hypothetical protein WEB87_03040 [Bacteriovoracaceae bacterium]